MVAALQLNINPSISRPFHSHSQPGVTAVMSPIRKHVSTRSGVERELRRGPAEAETEHGEGAQPGGNSYTSDSPSRARGARPPVTPILEQSYPGTPNEQEIIPFPPHPMSKLGVSQSYRGAPQRAGDQLQGAGWTRKSQPRGPTRVSSERNENDQDHRHQQGSFSTEAGKAAVDELEPTGKEEDGSEVIGKEKHHSIIIGKASEVADALIGSSLPRAGDIDSRNQWQRQSDRELNDKLDGMEARQKRIEDMLARLLDSSDKARGGSEATN
jgi:hypothetical protein